MHVVLHVAVTWKPDQRGAGPSHGLNYTLRLVQLPAAVACGRQPVTGSPEGSVIEGVASDLEERVRRKRPCVVRIGGSPEAGEEQSRGEPPGSKHGSQLPGVPPLDHPARQ